MSPPLGLRGDELDLFMEFHAELYRVIRRTVRSSPEIADDACGFAWVQFLREQPDRDQNWQGWMYRVAQHEAWRLNALEWQERDLRGKEGELIHLPTRATATTSAFASTRRWSSSSGCRRRCNALC